MQLNADRSRPARLDSARLAWVESPVTGIQRRMLERDGDEVARATSLVRYAPRSAFPAHVHDAGEEIFVLEGVFSDETGDYPAGFYLRNPPGSRHAPASGPGAVILVKLCQMPSAETVPIRIDARSPAWQELGDRSAEALLFDAPWERVVLQRFAPGHMGPVVEWDRGVELFVLDGEVIVDGQACGAGTWLRYPPGAALAFGSPLGARIYRKSGHLGQPPHA